MPGPPTLLYRNSRLSQENTINSNHCGSFSNLPPPWSSPDLELSWLEQEQITLIYLGHKLQRNLFPWRNLPLLLPGQGEATLQLGLFHNLGGFLSIVSVAVIVGPSEWSLVVARETARVLTSENTVLKLMIDL